jgi:hypothetical protein
VEPTGRHFTLPEHRHPRGRGVKLPETLPEEKILVEKHPELASHVQALKEHSFGRGTLPLRRLLVTVNDYPREPLQRALKDYRRLAVPASRAGFLGFARPRKAERTSANRSVR